MPRRLGDTTMARFVYLNVNPDGLTESDCVVRAITLASGLPYEEVEDKLWLTAELLNCDMLCRFCYKNFIENILKYPEVETDDMTVDEFADAHPYGTYLVRVPNHLTVVVDNVIYDIWDCRDEISTIAWQAE